MLETTKRNDLASDLQVEKLGDASFRMLKVYLSPRESICVETGAMLSQSPNIECDIKLNGKSLLTALVMRFLGGESFFYNQYKNQSSSVGHILLSQVTPGEIIEKKLAPGEALFVESGAFVARTHQVNFSVVFAGFTSWIVGEGLFRLRFEGPGTIWYGSYGAVVEKEVNGDLIVDSGFLLSYSPSLKLKLRVPGGWLSSLFSKEGFVLLLSGKGTVQLQTRSLKGLAQWLNPKFWG